MFGTIRKHQKWLWAVIITLTIISFVIFFSPYQRMSGGAQARNHGSIFGKRITDQEYVDAWRDVHLHHLFMSGRWADEDRRSGFDPDRDAYQWLLFCREQQQFGITVNDQTAERIARQLLRHLGVDSPQLFMQRVLQPKGYSVDDLERYARHYAGLQQLVATIGSSGKLVPPDEVKAFYERDHQEVAAEAALFSTSNYEASVPVPAEALAQFYSNRVANYIIPERVQVSYAWFNATNFIPKAQEQITNLTELVEANYQRLGTNAVPDAKTPEEAKAKIRERIIQQNALMLARAKAMDFANALFAINPLKAENLKTFAASNDVPVKVTAPFDRDEGPRDIKVGPDFTKAAFSLSAEEPFAPPMMGEDGAYVISLEKKLPPETPSLDQIHDKIQTDYKRTQAMRLAQNSAAVFLQSVTNGLAQGKAFTNMCAESGVKPIVLPPFSMSTRTLGGNLDETVPLSQLKQAAFGLQTKPAMLIQTSEGAIVLYVKEKLPLDKAKEQTELPGYVAQFRTVRQREVFDEWLKRIQEPGLRDTPLGQQNKTPPAMGTKTASK